MFEKGSVVASGRHDHADAVGGNALHHVREHLGIGSVFKNAGVAERLRRSPAANFTGNERIRSSGRNSQIVFEHVPGLVNGLHKINACNMGIDIPGRRDTVAGTKKTGRRKHKIRRNDASPNNFLFAVDIQQKGVQRPHPLRKPR